MAKARCILCGAELVGKSCPRCIPGDGGDGRIERDTDKARPAAKRRRAAAPEPGPAPTMQDRPVAELPEETDKVAALERQPARSPHPPQPEPEDGDAAAAESESETPARPRSRTEEKAGWYALAGIERPADLPSAHGEASDLPPPTSHAEDELRGYHPAAIVFLATGLSCFAVAATGRPPDALAGFSNLIAGVMLLKHYSWARFLALAFGALHIGKMAFGLALTGSSVFVVAMLPTLCVFAAFLLDEARWRAVAAGVGVLLAFSWVGFAALRPVEAERDDAMADYVIADGRWADDRFGLAVAVPKGVVLYDAVKAIESFKDEKAGIIGMFVKSAVKKWSGSERLLLKGKEIELDGMVKLVTLPPKVTTGSTLVTLFGEESKPIRDDDLVPRALRDTEGLAAEGWRHYQRRVVLVRAADGRLVTAVCNAKAAGADHLCQGFFEGLTLKPSLK